MSSNSQRALLGVSADDVTIRSASRGDGAALERLAQLDSTRLPRGPFLVAESAGRIRAAYSLDERRAIADPFRGTADLVTLLETRAGQLNGRGRRSSLRLLLRFRRSPAPQPPGFRFWSTRPSRRIAG